MKTIVHIKMQNSTRGILVSQIPHNNLDSTIDATHLHFGFELMRQAGALELPELPEVCTPWRHDTISITDLFSPKKGEESTP